MSGPLRYCGRDFTNDELGVIRQLAATLPTRQAISLALCDALGWHRPDGRRKDMSARVALLRMEADGLITLPPPRSKNNNRRTSRYASPTLELALPVPTSLPALGGVELIVVDTKASSARWRALVATHHYLGYVPFAGAQLRYLLESASGTLGALGFAASAWRCAPRDAHIGWDKATREARLHLVVGNARFLILPQVRVQNLASFVLAQLARRLPSDWRAAYGYEPVLLRPSSRPAVSPGRATGRRTGSTSGRPKDAASSTVTTSTRSP